MNWSMWAVPARWWQEVLRKRLGPALGAVLLDEPLKPSTCRNIDADALTELQLTAETEIGEFYIGVPANTAIDLADLQPGTEPHPAPPRQDLAATNYETTTDLDAIIAREERILAELAAATRTSSPLQAAQTVFGPKAGRHGH